VSFETCYYWQMFECGCSGTRSFHFSGVVPGSGVSASQITSEMHLCPLSFDEIGGIDTRLVVERLARFSRHEHVDDDRHLLFGIQVAQAVDDVDRILRDLAGPVVLIARISAASGITPTGSGSCIWTPRAVCPVGPSPSRS
jgi:hypothetical protein